MNGTSLVPVRTHCGALLIASLAVLATACAVPTKMEVAVSEGALEATSSAIVLFPTIDETNSFAGRGLVQCLKKEIGNKVARVLTVVDTKSFQDAMFPWFEPSTAPRTVSDLNSLLARPLVHQRISSLNVRYLISIAGGTKGDDGGYPGLFCGGSYAGAGCFGLGKRNKTTTLNAIVWDLVQGTKAGNVAVTSSGTSVIPAFIIPFPFLAYTETDACERLAGDLSQKLFGIKKQ